MNSPSLRLVSLSVMVLLMTGCPTTDPGMESAQQDNASLESYDLGSTRNSHRFGDIFLAGQPSVDDLGIATETGIRTVINLRHPQETPDLDEREIVTDLGMRYISLPFGGADELTDSVFNSARDLLKSAERPVLLHCSSANRVGAVWIPYRVLDNGVPLEQAINEALQIGLRSREYQEQAVQYVRENQ